MWTPALKLQKEVCDTVRSLCSLDLAWQSALRQRLGRGKSRFFRAKTWESTSVTWLKIRRTLNAPTLLGGGVIRLEVSACFPSSGVPDKMDDFSHDLTADFRLWRWWGDSFCKRNPVLHICSCVQWSPSAPLCCPRLAETPFPQIPQVTRMWGDTQKIQPLCLQMHF